MRLQSLLKMTALSSIALMPFVAHGATAEKTRACLDAFVAEQLAGKQPMTVRVDDYLIPRPLTLTTATPLYLEAVDRASGRTVASAECSMKHGTVTVKPVE
jgi:hypothetical protein